MKKQDEKPQQKVQRRGVVYVKHIPHGFYEEEMKKYFSQFGAVTNLRLSRSAKTGGSRGYAFIEFLSEDVAKIVADTMDGYLFFNKILKCSVVPKERVHEGLFRHFRYPFPLRKEVVRTVHNRRRTAETEKRSAQRRLATLERTRARLRKMGVRCNFAPEVPSDLLEPLPTKDTSRASSMAEDSGFPFLVDSSDDSLNFKTPPGARKMRKVKHGKPSVKTLVEVTPGRQTLSPKKSAKLLASPGSKSGRRGPVASTPCTTTAATTPATTPKVALKKTPTPKSTPASKSKRRRTPTKT